MEEISHKILFHEFKHHLLTGKSWILKNKNQWNDETEIRLKTLGNSQLDYYIGQLEPCEIKNEIAEELFRNGITSPEEYQTWLGGVYGYKEITISDNSRWTLRYIEKENYIHLHPSRHSQHTLRIKAGTLKTVFCTLLFGDVFSYPEINRIRTEKLNLSPVNEKAKHTELEKIFKLMKAVV